MENEINNTPIKSSKAFLSKEKAYHVYQFTLQKQCYGIGVREYARRHDITRDTLRAWIACYPKGLPYYNVGNPVEPMEELEDFKPRKIVKLSKAQLKDVKTEEKSSVVYSSTVHIQYCGAELEVASENLMSVLATIRAVNGLVQ
jgi:transposase-like protein